MKQVTPSPKLAVYLLHFETALYARRHYVGITTPKRLRQRMIEHTTGRGAIYTAARTIRNEPFQLANYWLTDDEQLEVRHAKRAEAIQLCPICRGLRIGVTYYPTKNAVEGSDRVSFVRSDIRPGSCQLPLFLNMKKDRTRRRRPPSNLLGHL